jgi:hypothetical protein
MSGEYFPDIFYRVDHLSLEEKEEICRKAKEMCYEWWTDELVGFRRQRVEMEFDEMVQKLYDDNFHHYVIIERRGYEDWKDPECFWSNHNWCGEIGFTSGIYYLWIYIKTEELAYFIEKYKLKPL